MVYLTDLAAAARKSGLKVVEIPGWQSRGRPASTGGFDPRGVLCHHTGGSSNDRGYVEWMARTGRSDLPAPLCQIALDRQGVVYICAAGRANHAGSARATGPMPSGDGNYLYIGIEALNTGSEGWTKAQYDAYVALCAALCEHYGWPASHVRAHRETSSTGKWDPGKLDMQKFRTDIAVAMRRGPAKEEDEMPNIDEFWNHTLNPRADKKDQMQADEALRIAANSALRQEKLLRRVINQGQNQTQRLAQLVNDLPEGATKNEIKALLEQLDVTFKVVVEEEAQ